MHYLTFELKGRAPLLMHNGRLADPLNPYTVALKRATEVKKKTETQHQEVARLEFLGGLYLNADGEPIIPCENIEAMVKYAGRRKKLGQECERAVVCLGDPGLVLGGGNWPKGETALWEWKNHVLAFRKTAGMRGSTVVRTRPMFATWTLRVELQLDTTMMNPDTLKDVLKIAGREIGLGDWIPRYGRFEAECVSERSA